MQGQLLSGRYQIIAPLGRGGFGQTYLAADRQQAGHPQCVLKKLHPVSQGAESLETARRLFEREADVLYKLGNHPQIPRLYTHFEEQGNFYLVLEFIEGTCLSEEFSHRSCTDEIQIVDWLKNILPVLGYIHRQNVIHRDIKPSNLIRRKSDNCLVLIDFGAVKEITTQIINKDSYTTFTIAIGSPGYIANEQMAGKPRFCSDIYSLGILCIQALTGLHPQQLPEDPRTSEIMWRDKADVSPGLADVLDKMVRYDFRQRYQSAVEVWQALQNVCLDVNRRPSLQNRRSNEKATHVAVVALPPTPGGEKFRRLEQLLAARQWREADRETNQLMLHLAGRQHKGYLRSEDINKFPTAELCTINNLWLAYSQGRFGFSVQHRLWQNLGGTKTAQQQLFCDFGEALGWRENHRWKPYGELDFSLNAPPGHLPACFVHDELKFGCAGTVWLVGILLDRWYNGQLTSPIAPPPLHPIPSPIPTITSDLPTATLVEVTATDTLAETMVKPTADRPTATTRLDVGKVKTAVTTADRLQIIKADITQLAVDAIVISTTPSLFGGVLCRVVHRKAGPELMREVQQIKPGCQPGEAVIAKGYNLPSRWVIHAIVSSWFLEKQSSGEILASCYRNCFALTRSYGINTIAFPSLGTGGFGFPLHTAARIAATEIKQFLDKNQSLEKVIQVCFTDDAYDAYLAAALEIIFGC